MASHKRMNHWTVNNDGTRTLLVAAAFLASLLANTLALVFVHERYPQTDPLPDITFSLVPEVAAAAVPAEIMCVVSQVIMWAVVLLHSSRWLLVRRCLGIATICYSIRAICIMCIQLPVPSKNTYCAPKISQTMGRNSTSSLYLRQTAMSVKEMLLGLGMNLFTRRHLCGDLIFSGHTIVLTLSWLVVNQYCPRKLGRWLSPVMCTLCLMAVAALVISRKHYTFDCMVSMYVCTNVFKVYNTILMSGEAVVSNSKTNVWTARNTLWAALVEFVEGGVELSSATNPLLQI